MARGAAGMLVLRVLQVGLEFLCGIILARLLGASSYGAYAFAVSWVGLLGILAACGFDRLLIREVAKFQSRGEWSLLRGMLRRAGQIVVLSSTILACGAAVSAQLLATGTESEIVLAFQLGMLIVPLIAVARARQAALQGLGRVVWGQVPETVVQPVGLLCLLGAAHLVLGISLRGPLAVALHAAAAGVACAWSIGLLRRSLPAAARAATPEFRTRLWLAGAVPFLWILGMSVVLMYVDVIMLGLLAGSEAAGIYRVAAQMAASVAFPLTAVNMAFAPAIAGLYAQHDMATLQRKATMAAQAILAMALPIAVVLILFGRPILALFGAEFVAGQSALTILVIGHLLNAAMGTSGYLLIMTKHERAAAVTFTVAAAINIVGHLLLIPLWGVNGAAAATAFSLVFVSVTFAVLTYWRLGIQPLGFWSSARGRIDNPIGSRADMI
jgi:O-antigen/teichoic acid export membrane protein